MSDRPSSNPEHLHLESPVFFDPNWYVRDAARFKALGDDIPEGLFTAKTISDVDPPAKPAGHNLDGNDPFQVPPGANLDTHWGERPDKPN